MERSPLEAQYAELAAELEWARREAALLRGLDDVDLTEPGRLIAGWIVRLSYGQCCESVVIERQQDLGDLCGKQKTHVGNAIDELVEAKILQVYPEGRLAPGASAEVSLRAPKVYEPLPDRASWRVRPRCRFGDEQAQAIARRVVESNRQRAAQGDFKRSEESFVPEPTLSQVIGGNARDAAFSRPSEPGEAGGRIQEHPPGIIGQKQTGGTLAEKCRQSIEEAEKAGAAGQHHRRQRAGQSGGEVTNLVTSRGAKLPNPEPGEVTNCVTSSRPRASDDRSSGHLGSVSKRSLKLSSGSSGSSDERDDPKGDEADESDAALSRKKARADDPLLGDLARAIGRPDLDGRNDWWRLAIGHSRSAVQHAIAAVKLHRGLKMPGGYAAMCFKEECRRRQKPFFEIALQAPKWMHGLKPED